MKMKEAHFLLSYHAGSACFGGLLREQEQSIYAMFKMALWAKNLSRILEKYLYK